MAKTIGLAVTPNKESLIDRFIEAFADALEVVKGVFAARAIKDVESWDGSASNYASTEAYCSACLIDVNSAAGRDEKAQSHCMLPVREPGDDADTYVRQAVYAAAGGRGIGRVKRPDDVPEDAWDSAVESAANKIIAAYGQMDETAPAGVYEAAGKEAPEGSERAVPIQVIYGYVLDGLTKLGLYPMDLYHDSDVMFAVGTRGGHLFKIPVVVMDNGDVALGEMQQVQMEFPARAGRGLSVTRQADGRYRWTSIACTAILNKAGEIDTTRLFDRFIEHAQIEGYPELDFYHIVGTELGRADYLARDGYTLIASGLFDNSPIARAAAEGIRNGAGYWGNSIMYSPLDGELVDIEGVAIRAMTDGILRKITILPEEDAAALFTTMEVNRMNERIKAALYKLLSDQELVDEMEERIDGVNRRVSAEALVARAADDILEAKAPVDTEAASESAVTETDAVVGLRRSLEEMAGMLQAAIDTIKELAETTETRLGALEQADEERKRAWLNDLPERKRTPAAPIWRPRESAPSTGDVPEPANARAERIMKSKL